MPIPRGARPRVDELAQRIEGSLYHPDAAAGERYVVRVRVFANYQQSAAGAAPALARG
jgi:hypothetical protein